MGFERINTIVERVMDRLADTSGQSELAGYATANSRPYLRAVPAGSHPVECLPMGKEKACIGAGSLLTAGRKRSGRDDEAVRVGISADDSREVGVPGATIVRFAQHYGGRTLRNLN